MAAAGTRNGTDRHGARLGVMIRLFALPGLALAACTQTAAAPGAEQAVERVEPISIVDVKGGPAECPLAVRFASYAMGIDGSAAKQIGALLTSEPAVAAVTRHRWGMEGENTLCVQLRPGADPAGIAERIRPLLPQKPRGPIEVVVAGSTTIRAPIPLETR